jgi:hypothetical protein
VDDSAPPPPPPANPTPVSVPSASDAPDPAGAAASEGDPDPSWWFRLAQADALLDGTPDGVEDDPIPDPLYRQLTADTVERLAVRLVIPLFVGRPDPALAIRPADGPVVQGP